jgi:hypothetical protein
MRCVFTVPHGAEIEFGISGAITIRHPRYATVRLRAKLPGAFKWRLSAITTKGQTLELRR